MKFKKNADYMKFFATVKKCKGDVLFYTLEGDQLNLSSTISHFLFMTMMGHEGSMISGDVKCVNEEDIELLKEFLDIEK